MLQLSVVLGQLLVVRKRADQGANQPQRALEVPDFFKKIGQQIAENPEYADDLLAPFKSQGAADVTDVGIVVRGKFTTRPGGQWMIRKEIYNRVQKAFEENGISFARREVFVRVSDDDEEELTPDQKRAAGAAAAQAAEPTA